MSAPSLTIDYVPQVADLHAPAGGDALVVSGFAATFDLDRQGDVFEPWALDKALQTYMATNPVVLFAHDKKRPPIGKVIDARIDRQRGLWVKALLPRPAAGTWAAGVWEAVKQGLLKAFSVGGRWFRLPADGYSRIIGADLHEISLAPVAVNGFAHATNVDEVRHVKAMSDGRFEDAVRAEREREQVASVREKLARVELALDLVELNLRAQRL
jgi:HK97 family phage prohead protease